MSGWRAADSSHGLAGQVVVLTGASSGIGHATALRFAAQGARLVLAARGREGLEAVARECQALGAEALAVPTDVADAAQVAALAERARARFGGIDLWINNAGIAVFGRAEELPLEDFHQVLGTNFFGTLHGSRQALAEFARRGRGRLINVASILGQQGVSYMSPYVVAKAAILGLDGCLRQERQHRGITISTILPSAMDTPIWQHAGNRTGRRVHPLPPIYEPEMVARAILRCAQHPRRMVYAGWGGHLATLTHKLWPGLYEGLAERVVPLTLFARGRAEPSDGNLFHPSAPPLTARGGWRGVKWRRRLLAAAAGAGAAGVLTASAWSAMRALRGAAPRPARPASRAA